MTLVIKKPTTAKLVMRKGWQPMDSDAATYIAAVEAADGQALEEKVKIAIDNFVLGCKADGIWSAIKASCILAGARTLSGALVPLVGSAPMRLGTEGGWNYNRETGLAGNGTDNYLDSNRNNNADPQDSRHLAVFIGASSSTINRYLIGNRGLTGNPSWIVWRSGNDFRTRLSQGVNTDFTVPDQSLGFKAVSRADSSNISARYGGSTYTQSRSSGAPLDENIYVLSASGTVGPAATRFSFYSIGEALNLTLLDARVTDLINAIGAAIP